MPTNFGYECEGLEDQVEASGSIYLVKIVLSGGHASGESFTEAQVQFDCLAAWTDPPSIVEWPEGPPAPRLRLDEVELARADIDGDELTLRAQGIGTIARHRVLWEQNAIVHLKCESTSALRLLNERVKPVQDFLVFTLGRSVRLTAFHLRLTGPGEVERWAKVYFEAVQPTQRSLVDVGVVVRRSAPTLFMLHDCPLPFEALMPCWFSLWKNYRQAISLLHAPYYVDFMFGEHRYASIFQGAEAFVKSFSKGREKSPSEHEARVAAITSAARAANVDSAHVEWAERVLQSRNDRPLRERIRELTTSTGSVGAAVFSACPDFAEKVTGGRTGVSHGGQSQLLDANSKHWFGDVLRWIIRTRLLIELGVDMGEAGRIVSGKAAFRYSVARISHSE